MTRFGAVPDRGFRPPTDPSKVLRERRRPVVADGRRAPILVTRMTAATRARFDAQLAAFLAGFALIRAADLTAGYGFPMPGEAVDAWEIAVAELRILNAQTGGRQ